MLCLLLFFFPPNVALCVRTKHPRLGLIWWKWTFGGFFFPSKCCCEFNVACLPRSGKLCPDLQVSCIGPLLWGRLFGIVSGLFPPNGRATSDVIFSLGIIHGNGAPVVVMLKKFKSSNSFLKFFYESQEELFGPRTSDRDQRERRYRF